MEYINHQKKPTSQDKVCQEEANISNTKTTNQCSLNTMTLIKRKQNNLISQHSNIQMDVATNHQNQKKRMQCYASATIKTHI